MQVVISLLDSDLYLYGRLRMQLYACALPIMRRLTEAKQIRLY